MSITHDPAQKKHPPIGLTEKPSTETVRFVLPPARDKTESEKLFDSLLPHAHQGFEQRKQRAEGFRDTLVRLQTDRIDPSKGGNHLGSQIDLTGLSPNIPVIIVGDLHGELDSLKKILLDANNLDRILKGEVVLLLLGDLIHPEVGDLTNMEGSIRLHELYMELKTKAPHHVFSLIGNHDPIFEFTAKGAWVDKVTDTGITKEKVCIRQAEEYRNSLDFAIIAGGGDVFDSMDYQFLLAQCTELGSFFAVGDGFSAVHAGPIKELSLEQMRSSMPFDSVAEIEAFHHESEKEDHKVDLDDPVSISRLMYRCAAWSRYEIKTSSNIPYSWDDVKDFMNRVEQPNGILFAGHTPPNDPKDWHQFLHPTQLQAEAASKHCILTATRRLSLGYAIMRDHSLDLRELTKPPFE